MLRARHSKSRVSRIDVREITPCSGYARSMTWFFGALVVVFGVTLLGFCVWSVVRTDDARRFVGLFASSASAHYKEQFARLIAGLGLLGNSPHMRFSTFFEVLGWAIVVTALVLIALPWRWHHRFGLLVIPLAQKYVIAYGMMAGLLGGFLIYSTVA
ncbi:MAG: hypothetical protein KDC35_19425 [Acidobacteria bacterium]|nr:hypothetical protein [Acidobacteriota bacterium]